MGGCEDDSMDEDDSGNDVELKRHEVGEKSVDKMASSFAELDDVDSGRSDRMAGGLLSELHASTEPADQAAVIQKIEDILEESTDPNPHDLPSFSEDEGTGSGRAVFFGSRASETELPTAEDMIASTAHDEKL